jgi:hypothetical protein
MLSISTLAKSWAATDCTVLGTGELAGSGGTFVRKVIFVGSTPFSGSTFFHMILANDPRGFSCGEVRSLFQPRAAHHIKPECGCGNEQCDVWTRVHHGGEDNLYETIFGLFPEVEFIVDSSKSPFWIRSQSERLSRKGIEVKNIVIWKTPLEFAYSCKRRAYKKDWDKEWITYYRLYATLVDHWRSVAYRPLTRDPAVLERACDYLGIPHFQGKERFWEKTQHALFGNYSARFHLYSEDQARHFLGDPTLQGKMAHYRSIYYETVGDAALREEVEATVNSDESFGGLESLLIAHDVTNDLGIDGDTDAMRLPAFYLGYRRLGYLLRAVWGKFRYGRHNQS